jgi:hypothetical protein
LYFGGEAISVSVEEIASSQRTLLATTLRSSNNYKRVSEAAISGPFGYNEQKRPVVDPEKDKFLGRIKFLDSNPSTPFVPGACRCGTAGSGQRLRDDE